jgi:hypothetical protein
MELWLHPAERGEISILSCHLMMLKGELWVWLSHTVARLELDEQF